jgi:hypothetical protein
MISIYPNPVQNVLFVKNIGSNDTEIRVYDILGKLIEIQKTTESTQIDVSGYRQGVYFLKIGNSTHKFIKE